jgi:hypothetical protein
MTGFHRMRGLLAMVGLALLGPVCAGLMLMAVPGVAGPLALPDGLRAELDRAPRRFERAATALILGYGGPRGLDAAGVEAFLNVERARIRMRERRRLLLADLDDDGAVSAAELEVLARIEGVATRARLRESYARADQDGDGVVTQAELRQTVQAVIRAELSLEWEARLRAVLLFDADGDGFVTMVELQAGLAGLRPDV